MSELKPCPFCGGEAHVMAQHWDDGSHVWWVECRACGAEGKRCDDGLEAIDAWNMRDERTCECVPEYQKSPIDGKTIVLHRCSACHWLMRPHMDYCPNCGAKVVSE